MCTFFIKIRFRNRNICFILLIVSVMAGKINRSVVMNEVKAYVIITLGLLCFVLGWKLFLLPQDIIGGGVVGIAAIVEKTAHISSGIIALVINMFLLFLGFRIIGFGFGFKTIYGALVMSLFLGVIPEHTIEVERFAACIIGGGMSGLGLAMVFSVGGSTGGTDIIAMIVNKYYRSISLGRVVLYCDIVIISSSYFVYRSLETIVYGFCVMFILSISLDAVLNGFRQSIQFFIFSPKHDDIAAAISENLIRGVTLIEGEGWYSKNKSKIVMVVVKKNQASRVFKLVNEIDPQAFVSQASVSGVYGKGFMRIDT